MTWLKNETLKWGTPLEVYTSQVEHVLMNALVCFCVQVYVPSWLYRAELWKQVHPMQSLTLSQWWGVPRGGCLELQVSVPHRWVCPITSISMTTVSVNVLRRVTISVGPGTLSHWHVSWMAVSPPFFLYPSLSVVFLCLKCLCEHMIGRTHPSTHMSHFWDYWPHFDQIYQQ